MAQRLKVLLLIPHLGGGGAEQVTALLARNLSREKYELHLGLVTQTRTEDGRLAPWVTIHALGAKRVRGGWMRLLRLVWRLRPQLMLVGMAHLNSLVLLLRPLLPRETRVVVRQNATVSAALAFGDLPWFTRSLYQRLYRRADRIICQTRAMAEDLAQEMGVGNQQIAVLANPVDVEAIRGAAAADEPVWAGPGPHLLAVGRLARVKGFDLLLRALAAIRRSFPQTDLAVAGTGPEERALKQLAAKLGLEEAVRWMGHVEEPAALYGGAALFVLSSRHEGMPNALLEAAAGGLPIVAVPASPGVVELLREQTGVWLAKEVSAQALAGALLAALDTLPPGARFPHPWIQQFSLAPAMRAYERLIDDVAKEWRR